MDDLCGKMTDDLRPVQQYSDLDQQLRHFGLRVRTIEGDGNCFFRAMSDQLTGNCDAHGVYRKDTADYMLRHRDLFKDFILEEENYEEYVNGLGQDAIYVDNDSVLAFARLLRINVVVHQLNQSPLLISGTTEPNAKEVHVSYAPQHYNSVRWFDEDSTVDVPAEVTRIAIRRLRAIHARERRRRQSGSSAEGGSDQLSSRSTSQSNSEPETDVHISDQTTREAIENLARDKKTTYDRAFEVLQKVDFDIEAAGKILDNAEGKSRPKTARKSAKSSRK